MRRTPLRRRRQPDPVKREDRADVFSRDKGCVLFWMEPGHECRDRFGNRHSPDDFGRLTLEHVKRDLRAGKRAESTPDRMVTLCGSANARPPSRVQRALFREYLEGVGA